MGRRQLIDDVRDVLAKTGFYVSEKHGARGLSFDIVARRDDLLVFLKVLQNVDAFGKGNAEELRLIAKTLNGAPLVVGDRSGGGSLEEGVIYSRFGVPIVSKQTFVDLFVDGVPPFVFSAPGGLYVRLDGEALRAARERRNVSLGALAEIAGVSRRTIQMYMEGMSATVDIALRLERFLGDSLVVPADPFAYAREMEAAPERLDRFEAFERDVFRRLMALGYDVLPILRSPFEGFATHDSLFLTGVPTRAEPIERKAQIVSNISAVVERDAVLFVQARTEVQTLEGTPLILRSELRRIRDRDEIEELIAERRK